MTKNLVIFFHSMFSITYQQTQSQTQARVRFLLFAIFLRSKTDPEKYLQFLLFVAHYHKQYYSWMSIEYPNNKYNLSRRILLAISKSIRWNVLIKDMSGGISYHISNICRSTASQLNTLIRLGAFLNLRQEIFW